MQHKPWKDVQMFRLRGSLAKLKWLPHQGYVIGDKLNSVTQVTSSHREEGIFDRQN
jgi:hypothetical protein